MTTPQELAPTTSDGCDRCDTRALLRRTTVGVARTPTVRHAAVDLLNLLNDRDDADPVAFRTALGVMAAVGLNVQPRDVRVRFTVDADGDLTLSVDQARGLWFREAGRITRVRLWHDGLTGAAQVVGNVDEVTGTEAVSFVLDHLPA